MIRSRWSEFGREHTTAFSILRAIAGGLVEPPGRRDRRRRDHALLHGLRARAALVPWRDAVEEAHYGVFTIGRVSETIRDEARRLDIALREL